MIDHRAIRFFQGLSKVKESNHSFFTVVGDISLNHVNEMYQVAKSTMVPKRIQKSYTWFRDDAVGNLNSKDLYNANGTPVHVHYNTIFKDSKLPKEFEPGEYVYNEKYDSNAVKLDLLSEFETFRTVLSTINKTLAWLQLIKIDPMGYWSPKHNHPTEFVKDNYKLFWVPLNFVTNRFIGSYGCGYFEPKLGKIYAIDGVNYTYSTINIGMEPAYYLLATSVE